MKSEILLCVRSRDYTTFQDLAVEVRGFVGDRSLFRPEWPDLIMWHACSAEAIDAIIELLARGQIRIEPAPRDCYRTALDFPRLPIWRTQNFDKLPKGVTIWFPVVFVEPDEGGLSDRLQPRFA